MLPPRALLLDFGGVVAEAVDDTADVGFPTRVHELIGRSLPLDRIEADLAAADAARDRWRSNPENPELSHVQLWADFVAKDWPEQAREMAVGWADELTSAWARRKWAVVEGMTEVLEFTVGRGLPVSIVSNTRSGEAYRGFLERAGLTGAFAAQIYSDEAGVFKPNPGMIRAATQALDVPAGQCWFVGDSLSRDIECGRRAGVGAAILRPSRSWTNDRWQAEPDAVVADGHELLKLLKRALDV
ncbi:HAD superfamily hydrolase (TIGR01549 family) [Hamadaea flava]|uniref:HAD family hydrolase n=1 Tax=Hamadaea flava TaxID=1742688 RepID=A0ABV8LSK0_9ACTN|nr:HAD-IA family hydrolase [Hamadaea flava]MCP2328150.1 HAD superfamily hydrolase (TIGR01549 family) [Hamadaea flava]